MGSSHGGRTLPVLVGILAATASCSPDAPQETRPRPDILFVGCKAPLLASSGKTITNFLHDEDKSHRLRELIFEVSDPNVAPAINGNSSTSYYALPISKAGAALIRRNVKQPGRPSYYRGMNDDDQWSIHRAVFGARAIQFNNQAGYGKLSEKNIFPTDTLIFLEPDWVIGVIVPKEKVSSAQAFKASASSALSALLQLQRGCPLPPHQT